MKNEFRSVGQPVRKRRRCIFIVPSLKRGGAETQLVYLINGFDTVLFEKHLVVLEEKLDQLDKVDRQEIKLHHFPKQRKLDWRVIKSIARLIDDEEIDVIHGTIQYSVFIGWLARMFAKRNPRLLAAIHTTKNVGLKEELFDRILYRPVLKRCDHVIFVCNNQRDYWLRKYPELELNSSIIYNGIDPSKFCRSDYQQKGEMLLQKSAIPEDVFVITCVAGFRPEKGHAILLHAFSTLPGKPRLLLAGDGPLRANTEVLARELRVDDRVFFLGNLADVRPVLAITDLMVLASTAVETFSMAMLEAMAMQVPVVASNIGGLSEAIIEGETGSLVPPGDETSLRKALENHLLCKSKALKPTKCRQQVAKRFHVNQMIEKTSRICLEGAPGTT